jgi:hypothetical protein
MKRSLSTVIGSVTIGRRNSLPLKGGGLGWGSADSRFLPPATPTPTLPLSGGWRSALALFSKNGNTQWTR